MRPCTALLLAGLFLAPCASLLGAAPTAPDRAPGSGSLLLACVLAFGAAFVGGGLQWIVLRDTKGDLGAGGGLPLNLGLTFTVIPLALAVSVMDSVSGAGLVALLASFALGWAALWWLVRRKKPRA